MGLRKYIRNDGNLLRVYLFAFLSIITMCFIFSQSMLSGEESGDLSAGVVTWLRPILDPNEVLTEETFHHYVRKAAHFTEFAVFGSFLAGFYIYLGKLKSRRYTAMALYAALQVAVCDEFIQYFTGRGSAVTDVVIDFSGALFAMGIICVLAYIKKKLGDR